MSDLDIEAILIEWGRWSRGGFSGRVQQVITEFVLPPNITDELALQVDKAVIAAGVKDFVLRHVLELHYKDGKGLIEIAGDLRVGRHKLDKTLSEAIGFVGGYLSNFSKAA